MEKHLQSAKGKRPINLGFYTHPAKTSFKSEGKNNTFSNKN